MSERQSPLQKNVSDISDDDWNFFTQEVWINKLDNFQKNLFKAIEFRDIELYWCILEQLYAEWKYPEAFRVEG